MSAKSRSVSWLVSDVVGSSKIMMRASMLSAFAISTSYCSPAESFSTSVSGETSRPTCSSSAAERW